MAESQTVTKFIPAMIVGLSAFIAIFDVTAISLALPAIGATFSLDVADYAWIMNAYSLTLTIMLISAGTIADRQGPRLTLICGAVIFLAASIVCAFAPSYGLLVAGRALQGIGAACISCGGYALIGRLYSEKADRVRAFALVGTLGGTALAVGPGLGGIVAGELGWKWVFLLNIPVCFTIIGGASIAMKEQKPSAVRSFDVVGIFSFSLLLFMSSWLFLYGPKIGMIVLDVQEWLAIMVILLAAFIVVEARSEYPAVDVQLFKRREFVGLALVPLSLAISYWSLLVFIPLFLQASLHLGIERISYIVLFFTLPMFIVPYMVTGIAARAKQSRYFSGGLIMVSIGCFIISAGAYSDDYNVSIVGMVVGGIGAASIQTQVSGALIACAPEHRAGSVSAITTILRQGGFAVGTAFLSKVMRLDVNYGGHEVDPFPVLFFTCALVAAIGSIGAFWLINTDGDR